MRNIVEATKAYEKWAGGQVRLIADDLNHKHQAMAESPVAFLRATYYRWVETFPQVCESAAATPVVWSVGDLHIENFGLWRDAEGRTVWGINDFDECDRLPYANDLIRLATSAHLAAQEMGTVADLEEICTMIVKGYAKELARGGKPIVIGIGGRWLRSLLPENMRRPIRFWDKLYSARKVYPQETSIRAAAERALPKHTTDRGCGHRTAGLGSLGRARVVAWGMWSGGPIAREAKQLLPPATSFIDASRSAQIHYAALLSRAVRAPDPYTVVRGDVVVRRLAPESGKIHLETIAEVDDPRLLLLMGRETANIHLASRRTIERVGQDLSRSKPGRLAKDVERMTQQTLKDFRRWRKQ